MYNTNKTIQQPLNEMRNISMTPQAGRKQTERFACRSHTSLVSLKPQSARYEQLFPASKLRINSPYKYFARNESKEH